MIDKREARFWLEYCYPTTIIKDRYNGDNSIVQPIEITFDRLLAYAKRRIDGTYDDIYV